MAGRLTLDQKIGVRIPVPQPEYDIREHIASAPLLYCIFPHKLTTFSAFMCLT